MLTGLTNYRAQKIGEALSLHRFRFFVAFFFALSWIAPPLLAADPCETAFQKVSAKAPSLREKPVAPLRISRADGKRLQSLLEEKAGNSHTHSTPSTEALLTLAEKNLPPEEAKAFSEWLLGQFFEDPLVSFEDHFLGRQHQAFPSGPTRYNRNGERPFEGYLAAREFLKGIPLAEVGLQHILEAHRRLLSRESIRGDKGKVFQTDRMPARNSQGLKDSEIGVIRSESVGFDVLNGIIPSALDGTGHRASEIDRDNLYVKQMRNGRLSYAPLFRWRSIDGRKPLSDSLVRKLVALEQKYGTVGLREMNSPELVAAQQEMLTELTDRLWKESVRDVQSAKTQGEVVAAAARFQKDFISIHPFLDGNGRAARLLTEKLLESKGLPAPLYTHWGEDLTLPQEQLENQIAHGVLLSRDYHAALASALEKGESFSEVPQPVVSHRAKELLGGPQEPWNDKAFLTWVEKNRESLQSFPQAVRAFYGSNQYFKEAMPGAFDLWKQAQEELPERHDAQFDGYEEWMKKLRSPGPGDRAIRLAPGVFQRGFARLSQSEIEHRAKMAAFYTDKPIYRGVPVDRYFTDEELVRLLAAPTPLTSGNGIPLHENPDSHFPVFQSFNQELLRGGDFLSAQAKAHTEGTQEEYFSTGMISFTDQEGIGRNWQFSSLQEVGVLFTARERTVGVIHTGNETERFGRLGLKHEYEHALVGGVDPESILAIEVKQQTQDPKNRVQRKTKKLKRINYNTVQISEVTFDGEDIPKVGTPTLWRIEPDGSIHKLE